MSRLERTIRRTIEAKTRKFARFYVSDNAQYKYWENAAWKDTLEQAIKNYERRG